MPPFRSEGGGSGGGLTATERDQLSAAYNASQDAVNATQVELNAFIAGSKAYDATTDVDRTITVAEVAESNGTFGLVVLSAATLTYEAGMPDGTEITISSKVAGLVANNPSNGETFDGQDGADMEGPGVVTFKKSGTNWIVCSEVSGGVVDDTTAAVDYTPNLPELYKWSLPGGGVAYQSIATLNLVQNRLMYQPILVDRPIAINAISTPLRVPATDSGGLLRAGICSADTDLNTDNDFAIGDVIVDLGTQDVSVAAGFPIFTPDDPIMLDPGLYYIAYGSNSGGVSLNYVRIMYKELMNYTPALSGVNSSFRSASFLYLNSQSGQITGGLTNQNRTALDAQTNNSFTTSPFLMDFDYV